jgi:hypothetical protein
MRFIITFAITSFILPTALFAQDQQIGARTKGMGGSYTAFEDDPVSIWLNPAGIATQQDQLSIAYQTYTAYPADQEAGPDDTTLFSVEAEPTLTDPAIIPSFLGAVFQVGDPESPMAVGICLARPYHLQYAMDEITDPFQTDFTPDSDVEQSLSRFRGAFAYDFLFRDTGFLTHLSLGLGLDIGFVNWSFRGPNENRQDKSTGFGFGGGLLAGIYDNGESFKMNFGIAYQSGIEYDFTIAPDLLPAFDMPQQFNAGITLYLLEGTPLSLTIDAQWIDWSETAEAPSFSVAFNRFEDAINFSIGAEYRFQVGETLFLYPRLGFRRFDAPWEDENNLPATGKYKLVLDTEGDVFNIFTLGFGLSWATEEGQIRSLDVAADAGGDAFNVALGYNHEF